jgi:hypothetical protein
LQFRYLIKTNTVTEEVAKINKTAPHNMVAFQSIQDCNDIISYDGDAVDLYLDTYVTGALIGYKSDFIEGTIEMKDLGYSSTAAGSTKITGCGVAHYILSDDYGRKCDLKIPANYSEDCPYRLVSPQWIKKCEKANGVPKELQSHLDLEDDYCIFQFDRRTKSKKIYYHPTQMVPVMKVNEGLKSYKSFKSAFCSIIQEQSDRESEPIQDNTGSNDKVAFRSIEDTNDRSNLLKAATKIAKNKDIHVSIEDILNEDSHKPHSLSKV